MFLLFSGVLCRPTQPRMLYLPSLFLIVESWMLILSDAIEACNSLDVCLGSLVTSWRSCWHGPWRNFGQLATSGKIQPWSKFPPYGNHGSRCDLLESHNLRNSKRRKNVNPDSVSLATVYMIIPVLRYIAKVTQEEGGAQCITGSLAWRHV